MQKIEDLQSGDIDDVAKRQAEENSGKGETLSNQRLTFHGKEKIRSGPQKVRKKKSGRTVRDLCAHQKTGTPIVIAEERKT